MSWLSSTNPLWRFSVPSFLSFIQSLASAIKSSVSEDTLYFGKPTGAALECAYLAFSSITFGPLWDFIPYREGIFDAVLPVSDRKKG
ncbi:hypothetical protein HAX54_013310, partial [Datura stramonium]|nr:hypothetical protein [Datura stramonium]